ncbi:hypothetical protein ZHAS_00017498 [Anopheles sinensis]|uniref:Retrotrans_gag domain-containing protein n=1 Tax=Anopheles sinensis TaxID=74873 RepID=A0A084WGQ4_ANOSI|nr:hypothetical protein ZHAS_00017498 [Anopheles sinensis]
MTMSRSKKASTSEENIDNFDPDRQGASAKGWLKKVETFARENHLAPDQTYSFALGKLNGVAKEWLSHSKVTSWLEFRRAFVVAFPDVTSELKKSRTIERRKKLPKESVHEYVEEMLRLGKRLKLGEESIVRCIVDGLGDPVLDKAIPRGMGLQQLLKALEWQKEVEGLIERYGASKVSVESFERLADEMESFVLDGESWVDAISGDAEVLKTISSELNLILRQHRSSLSCGLFDLGSSKTHQIVVNLVQDALIYADKPKVPAKEDHTGSWQTSVISLLACDVIQKSSSSSFQSAHLDPDDSELLLDLSHLNTICCREAPNFLRPQPLLSALSAFRYFTLLDFNGGHLQISLEPHGPTRSYFSFATPYGAFEFRRAPRNFANTTIIFNKILIELARKLPPTDGVVVLNDVLVVPARDTSDGLQKLSRVLTALRAFGLTVDLRRSRFFLEHVQLFNWSVRHGKVITTGLPFEPGRPGDRLALQIKLSDDGTKCEALLEQLTEDKRCQMETIENSHHPLGTAFCPRGKGNTTNSVGVNVSGEWSVTVCILTSLVGGWTLFCSTTVSMAMTDNGSLPADTSSSLSSCGRVNDDGVSRRMAGN